MMDGVTVLNTIYEQSVPIWVYLVLFTAMITVVVLVVQFAGYCSDILIISFIVIAALLGISIVVCGIISEPTNIPLKYEVTISDNVNLKEFNERYEIIERCGDIYTIQDKQE